jgi:hypothetical protein
VSAARWLSCALIGAVLTFWVTHDLGLTAPTVFSTFVVLSLCIAYAWHVWLGETS